MSFGINVFGPRHYWWKAFKNHPRLWYHRPSDCSTGGTGFCVPGLHVVFTWGRK